MKIWASSESHIEADDLVERTRILIEPYINNKLLESCLSDIDFLIRYVPIVMPEGMIASYPSRSKALIKKRIYDCAPQLNYQVFVSGSFDDQFAEYLRGISLAIPHLAKFGLTKEEVGIFCNILIEALQHFCANNDPDDKNPVKNSASNGTVH